MTSIEIIGHRGYSARAPENTLAAIERAVEAGADAVEWDVQVASCGTPVLFHDRSLGRTTNGVGPVHRRSLGQLKALDAGGWFGTGFEGERVPSLAEALRAVKDSGLRVYCEVKAYRELEDLDRMVEIVHRGELAARVAFIASDWSILDRIAGRHGDGEVGFIVDAAERFQEGLERAQRSGHAFLDLDVRLVLQDPTLATRARDAGVVVGVWTANDPADADRLLQAGVSRFTTDEVERLLDWRNRLPTGVD